MFGTLISGIGLDTSATDNSIKIIMYHDIATNDTEERVHDCDAAVRFLFLIANRTNLFLFIIFVSKVYRSYIYYCVNLLLYG